MNNQSTHDSINMRRIVSNLGQDRCTELSEHKGLRIELCLRFEGIRTIIAQIDYAQLMQGRGEHTDIGLTITFFPLITYIFRLAMLGLTCVRLLRMHSERIFVPDPLQQGSYCMPASRLVTG